MRFKNKNEVSDDDKLDLTPLLDVSFIILIFFILTTTFIENNELIEHPPFESHTLVAESDEAVILAFACGKRGGNFYEKDTFRLKKKLNI